MNPNVGAVRLNQKAQTQALAMNDYLQLPHNKSFQRIRITNGDTILTGQMFSDYCCRINSRGERKVRIIVVTSR